MPVALWAYLGRKTSVAHPDLLLDVAVPDFGGAPLRTKLFVDGLHEAWSNGPLMVQKFDAIVVGAGLNGSWVAKEFTSAGMKVALVDAGPLLADSMFSPGRLRPNVFDSRYHLFRLKLLLKGDKERAL